MVFMTQIQKNAGAIKFDTISFEDVLKKRIKRDGHRFTSSQETNYQLDF
jgi:hypothetical protein